MPLNIPDSVFITIQKRHLPPNYQMPQMERAENHYSMGYIISGDRQIITPYAKYEIHKGDMFLIPPMLYHKTFALSDAPYENYLIKLSIPFSQMFCKEMDEKLWHYLFEQKYFSFQRQTAEKAEAMLQDMLYIYEKDEPYSFTLVKGIFYRLALMMQEENKAENVYTFKTTLSKEIMEAMYYIEKKHTENITLSSAAKEVGFSEGHFSRLFHSQVGVTFSQYLINVRLRHTKELLINTDLSVSDIALAVGFASGDYLSACFNKYEHTTPSNFRKKRE